MERIAITGFGEAVQNAFSGDLSFPIWALFGRESSHDVDAFPDLPRPPDLPDTVTVFPDAFPVAGSPALVRADGLLAAIGVLVRREPTAGCVYPDP